MNTNAFGDKYDPKSYEVIPEYNLKEAYAEIRRLESKIIEKNSLITTMAWHINKWRVEPDQLSIMRRLYAPEVISVLKRAQEST